MAATGSSRPSGNEHEFVHGAHDLLAPGVPRVNENYASANSRSLHAGTQGLHDPDAFNAWAGWQLLERSNGDAANPLILHRMIRRRRARGEPQKPGEPNLSTAGVPLLPGPIPSAPCPCCVHHLCP